MLILTLPANKQIFWQLNIELIDNTVNRLIDNILNSFWLMIKRRHWRHNDSAQLSGLYHQAQVP